ncbi:MULTISPECIES: MFS transporter [unclassified Acinetobacter]|uniref:MFS transporter n=1 Tax=unclassified Acinetobacter TaxID=196816 RepID=UPI00244D4B35|nr:MULTISPECIES: MFS transporter [unclassified Acinetobacter]MDH0031543.1 MFS transporter [Acinetobacter sp. GD04021]MDH0886886.1 MFS transporter [Acinetobacter sp. GD03873]MDH1083301.1 MFS transporter [Acinetobacter sp. GD03983]MDH2190202.1 MFS transporter [Acinetobacter sp. GD03645]MDH2203319.1 MFS transporter [Acinetobacter sp. GD03647]
MNQLPRYVYYLLAAQALNLIAAVLSVTVAAIVGLKLAPTQALATVPYGLQFLAMLLTTFIFSFLMKKLGRHLVFQFGCICLFLAGVLGYLALQQQQFYLLCLSHFSLGLFISTANFYRFAASDRLATELIPKATAMVISGGVIAAMIAPILAIQFQQVQGLPDFTAIYFIFSVLALLLSPILYLWNKKFQHQQTQQIMVEPIQRAKLPSSLIIAAVISGAFAYYIMNVMMIMSSLHLKEHHSFHYASISIQLHVLAMFIPSFFVSKLIQRWGTHTTIYVGFALLMLSSLIPMIEQVGIYMNVALIVLGVGWNFAYSGASTLLAGLNEQQKHRVQGINETGIALFATLGAFLPAPILSSLGWINANLLALSMSFMVFILLLVLSRQGQSPSKVSSD